MHFKGLLVEAAPPAAVAPHFDVRQETHFDRALSLAFAIGAAPTGRVEGKAARAVAADPRLIAPRVDAADVVPESDIGCRTGARCAPDRRLVDFQHATQGLRSTQAAQAGQ